MIKVKNGKAVTQFGFGDIALTPTINADNVGSLEIGEFYKEHSTGSLVDSREVKENFVKLEFPTADSMLPLINALVGMHNEMRLSEVSEVLSSVEVR